MLLIPVGLSVIVFGLASRTAMPGVVMLGVVAIGVVLSVLPVLYLVRAVRIDLALEKKDLALREPGTVQLLTVASSLIHDDESWDYWELTTDMQIRLDSGPTFRGSYCTATYAGPSHFDAWFRVGASLRCLYNPTNPDHVYVFPYAAPNDALPGDWPAVALGQRQPILGAQSEGGHLFSSAT